MKSPPSNPSRAVVALASIIPLWLSEPDPWLKIFQVGPELLQALNYTVLLDFPSQVDSFVMLCVWRQGSSAEGIPQRPGLLFPMQPS